MKKRILAMILCLAMVLCMVPVAASAEETTTETPKTYLALGDSISTGYGLGEEDKAFTEQVAEANSFTLNNQAAEGETSATLLAKGSVEGAVAAIQGADVITITIGGNDLMEALYTYLMNTYNATQEDEGSKVTLDQVKQLLASGDSTALQAALTLLPGFAESADAKTALAEFTSNLTQIATEIKTLNGDATVIFVTQYNPYSFLAKALAETPYASFATTLSTAFEAGVTALNQVITQVATTAGYQVADAYTAMAGATENPCNASISQEGTDLDFHPNAYGHTLIAQTVNALFAEEPAVEFPFTDVKDGAWYYDAVKYVFENKIMIGTDDEHTVFSPNLEVNRATVVQILYNLEGSPEVSGTSNFTDLEEKDWFLEPVLWAEQLGIVNGYEDNTFRARNAVSREEFAKMLYNYAKYKGYDLEAEADLTKYPDAGKISNWALEAMTWANGKGLITGHETNEIDPKGTTIRSQAATILMRFDQTIATK